MDTLHIHMRIFLCQCLFFRLSIELVKLNINLSYESSMDRKHYKLVTTEYRTQGRNK